MYNTISSHSQLGAWKCKSNQLARKYRFLYSPALQEIYDKQGKKIVSWFAKDARRTTILQRENDVCIMDSITQKITSKITLQRINACRLFLQITLLSEITSANGKFIKLNILKGQRNSNASTKIWPRQKTPDEATWKLWRALIKRTYCSYDNTISR